jgi:hypothetical protein
MRLRFPNAATKIATLALRSANKKDKWFSLQKLMGGENFDWKGTPLYALYSKHISAGLTNEEAIDQAGKDGGWLLKSLLDRDKRNFETKTDARSRIYLWMGEQESTSPK